MSRRNISNQERLREFQEIANGYDLIELLKRASTTDPRTGKADPVVASIVHSAYRRNFSDKVVHFDLESNQRRAIEHPDHILVEGRGMCRLYLQSFNASISKILIRYADFGGNLNSVYREFNSELSKYCATSLRFLQIEYAVERRCHRLNEVQSLLRSNRSLRTLHIFMPNVVDMHMGFLLDIISNNMILSELIVKTGVVPEPVTIEQITRLSRYRALTRLDLRSFRMVRAHANLIWNGIRALRVFSIRILKEGAPIQENQLLMRLVRTGTEYEFAPPISMTRRDDPVTFRRS